MAGEGECGGRGIRKEALGKRKMSANLARGGLAGNNEQNFILFYFKF